MKKTILISVLIILSSRAYSSYLDTWSNNNLCGWTTSSSTPEDIQKEIEKREILCYGGVEVYEVPPQESDTGKNGTTFPSPDSDLIEALHSKHGLGPKSKMGGY